MTTRSIFTINDELAEQRTKLDRVTTEYIEVSEHDTPGHRQRAANLARSLDRLHHAELRELETERDTELARIAADPANVESGSGCPGDAPQALLRRDPFGYSDGRETADEVRSKALTAIERWSADDQLKESATATVERLEDEPEGPSDVRGVSAHLIRYSHPQYVSAFRKFARDPVGYLADLTAEENRAWREAREYQTRAALGTAGAVLPSPLDPSIVLTNDGTVDPMRSVARVATTTAKDKRFITSAGSTFSFDPELSEVSDDTFDEAEVTIATEKAQGFIQASIEAAMDQPNFSSEVARIIADGKAQLEGAKFVTGSGTDEPTGIEVALTGTSSEVTAAGEALAPDDVYGLLEALPPRHRAAARWQLELSTLNHIHRLWNPTGTEPPLVEGSSLLRRPYVENSNVDPYSAVDDTTTATSRVLFVGDWSKYVILDRVGLTVSYLGPGLLQNPATNLPDGRVGWYAYWRVGADVLTTTAFRMLAVQTTA